MKKNVLFTMLLVAASSVVANANTFQLSGTYAVQSIQAGGKNSYPYSCLDEVNYGYATPAQNTSRVVIDSNTEGVSIGVQTSFGLIPAVSGAVGQYNVDASEFTYSGSSRVTRDPYTATLKRIGNGLVVSYKFADPAMDKTCVLTAVNN